MVTTTISCDATILRCARCDVEVAIAVASANATPGTCTCGTPLVVDRLCDRRFALQRDAVLIRCIAENREGWSCVDGSPRDYCSAHAHLAPSRPSSQFLDLTT